MLYWYQFFVTKLEYVVQDSAGRGDGVPDNHGDARGILEKRDTSGTQGRLKKPAG
jgi:hypothetical protein